MIRGTVFRASKPAVFGVDVKGILKTGTTMMREENRKVVGKIKELQKEGQKISEAKSGDKVAVSMDEPTVGRQIEEGDVLLSALTDNEKRILNELREHLTVDEKEILDSL